MGRCELSAVSLGCLSYGDSYTFKSGTVTMTVDYVMMDLAAASMMEICETLQDAELNLSDHLPLLVTLVCDHSCCTEEKCRSLVLIGRVLDCVEL